MESFGGATFETGTIRLRPSATAGVRASALRGRQMPVRRPRRGFTLVEVIVVLLLLGLVAALAAPVFILPDREKAGLAAVVRGARHLAE